MLEAAEEAKKVDGQDSVMVEDKIELETTEIKDADSMDTSVKSKFSAKTLKDEHGNYPVWMSMRRIKNQKRKNKSGPKQQGKARSSLGKVSKKKK